MSASFILVGLTEEITFELLLNIGEYDAIIGNIILRTLTTTLGDVWENVLRILVLVYICSNI